MEAQATAVLDTLMEKVQPHLMRIGHIFGAQTKLTLLVQVHGQPGCLILGNSGNDIGALIKSLRETAAMEAVDEAVSGGQ